MLSRIANGRTDLAFDWIEQGGDVDAQQDGASILQWCAYYGDVSAIRHLIACGADLAQLGRNLDLNGAAFHGHWQLCEFLIEQGADPNHSDGLAGETPLISAMSRPGVRQSRVAEVLISAGAKVDARCKDGEETGAFMRDVRTQGETALHRAAAIADMRAIQILLAASADVTAMDARGDTPLSWASRARRESAVLRLLCFPPHAIHPDHRPMDENLVGGPLP